MAFFPCRARGRDKDRIARADRATFAIDAAAFEKRSRPAAV